MPTISYSLRKLSKPFFAYVVFYLLVSFVINKFTYPTQGVNDDEFFAQLLSGEYTGSRESFTHISPASPQWFFGFIVTKFYMLNGSISWYFIILLATTILSLSFISSKVNVHFRKNNWSKIIIILLCTFFLFWFVPAPTYTATAFICALAGVFGIVQKETERPLKYSFLIPSMYLTWANSIRSESFYATLVIFFPALVTIILINKNIFVINFKRILTIAIFPAIIVLLNFSVDNHFFSNSDWNDYKKFNEARYLIQDNESERIISGNPDKFGWSAEEYRLFDSYNFIFLDSFSGNRLEKIYIESTSFSQEKLRFDITTIINRWNTYFKPFNGVVLSAFLLILFYSINMLIDKNYLNIFMFFTSILFSFLNISIVVAWIILFLRLPERIVFPISFFVPLLVVLINSHLVAPNQQNRKYSYGFFSFASYVLLILVLFPGFRYLYLQKSTPPYTSFWSEQKIFLKGISPDKVLIGNASQFKSIWSNPYISNKDLNNLNIYALGWYTFSPYWFQRGENLGIDGKNLGMEIATNPKAIWFSDDTITNDLIKLIFDKLQIEIKSNKIGSKIFDYGEYSAYSFVRIL